MAIGTNLRPGTKIQCIADQWDNEDKYPGCRHPRTGEVFTLEIYPATDVQIVGNVANGGHDHYRELLARGDTECACVSVQAMSPNYDFVRAVTGLPDDVIARIRAAEALRLGKPSP